MVYSERPIRPQDQTSTAKSMISSGNNSNQQKLDRKQKQGSHTLRGPAHVEQIHSTNNINNNNNSSSSSIYGSREKKGPRKDKLKWWKRVRIRVALLGLAVAVANCYAQATFCIAIVEMVLPADYISSQGAQSSSQSSQPPLTATSTTTNSSSTRPLNQLTALEANESSHIAMEDNSCPLEFKYRNFYDSWRFEPTDSESQTTSASMDNKQRQHHHQMDTSNRFDWDASQQGLLLGAFAIGLAPLQIIGGRLAEIYGSKWVLLAGCIGTGLTNLAIPYLAHFSFALSLVNRVLMGISQSGMEPGLMCLLSDWLTPQEASFFIAMLLCALCMGFFLGSLCSSFILAHGYGWPLTYYVCAGLNLSLALVWYVYADSWPRASKYITLDELKYIEEEQGNQKQQQPASRVVPSTSSTSSSFDLNNADDDECTSETTTATTSTTTKRTTVIAKPDGGKCELSLASSNISTGPRLDLVQEGGQRRVCDGFSKHLNNSKSSSDSSNINSNDNINSHNNNNNNANASKLTTVVELEDPLKAPWLNILSSRPVWAFIICKISIRWCGDVMANELPTYLANVLHLSIEINGLLNSISTALFAISSFITGWLVTSKMFTGKGDGGNFGLSSGGDHDDDDDLAVTTSNNNELNRRKTNLRKTFQSMASFGSAICLILMTNYDCDILISMSCLLLLSWFVVMGTGGELQIAYDMTSRYPGTLHGMACSLSVSGWLAPPLYGLILGDQPSSRARWAIVWYSTAAINVLGGLVFLLFADASPRDFDNPTAPQTKKKKMNEPNDLDEDHLNRRQLRSQKQQQQPPSPVDSQGYFNGALNTSSCESSPKSNHHHHHHHHQQQQQQQHHQSVTDPLSQQNAKLNPLDAAASIGFDCGKLIKCRQLESSFIQANVFHKSGGYRLADSPLQLEANDLIYPYKEPRINRAIGNPQEDENTTTTNNTTTTTTNTTSAKNNNNKPKGSIWSWLANLAQRTGTTTTTAAADAEVEGAPGGRTKSSSTPIDTHWKVSKSISVLANERAIETINQSRGSHDSNSSSIRLGLLDEHDNKRGSNGLGKHSDGRPSAAAAREPAAHQHGQPPRDGDDLAKNAAATGATAAAATVTSIIIKERMPGGEKNVPKASPLLETEGARQKTITHL